MPRLFERRNDERRGRHLVAASRMEKGRLVLCERPLLFQQNLTNVREAFVCHNCSAFVGDANVAMRRRFGEIRGESSSSISDPSGFIAGVVPCRHSCGHAYCSPECERDAFEAHHRWLCTGTADGPDHPLVQFKAFAAQTNEILLAAAQWWVVQHATDTGRTAESNGNDAEGNNGSVDGAYTDFVMEPWWDVSVLDLLHSNNPGGFAEAIHIQQAQREICEQAAELLNQALAAAAAAAAVARESERTVHIPPVSALDIARRLGSFSQNAIGFRSRHPLCREVFDPDFRMRWHSEIVMALEEARFLGECQDEDEDEDERENEGENKGASDVEGEGAADVGLEDGDDGDGTQGPPTPQEVATLLSGLFVDEDGTVMETSQPSGESDDAVEPDTQRVRDTTGDDLDYIFPPLDGTALYSTTCKMNHSCDPNVIVLFKRRSFGRLHPLVAHCVALRDIAEGEELTISYIENDQPYDERQLALASYGFTCRCTKCEFESTSENQNGTAIGVTSSLEENLFGSDDEEEAVPHSSSAGGGSSDDAEDEDMRGERDLEQLLERLESRSNHSQFGSLPLSMAARVFSYMIQTGSSLVDPSEEMENVESDIMSRILSRCLVGARERDYCLCRVSGIDLESHLFRELRCRGSFLSVGHREAYWCSVLSAAVGFAHEGSFLEALALLDKGLVLGLQRDNHCLHSFVEYVEFHTNEVAVGHVPPSVSVTIPKCPSTEHTHARGLARALGIKIDERHLPMSFEEFQREFLKTCRPVLFREYASSWKALDSVRNLRQLVHRHGHRLLPIEIGSMLPGPTESGPTYMKEELMTLRAFVETFLVASTNHGVWSLADATDCPTKRVAYMAQHALFSQIPDLSRDVVLRPDLCGPLGPDRVNAWVGTGGTRTPLHFDNYDNLLVQLVGVKYVRLYAVDATDELPRLSGSGECSSLGLQGNMSSLNCEIEETDEAQSAVKEAHVPYTEALLFPGDCLFIPSRVWHYVRSLSTSVSVNYWFDAP
jgi:Cupin-like domain/SET domain